MGFFSEIEEGLEKYIEKFFKGKAGERLQPVEIARQVAREMRRSRRTGLRGVYVPNRFTVSLAAADYADLEPILESLARELQDYITEKAAQKKYLLAGPVKVEFQEGREQETVDRRIMVEGSFDHLPVEEQEPYTPPPQDTMQFVPLRDAPGPARQNAGPREAWLEKNDGAGRERYPLLDEFTILGRRETCDICLKDSGVSRKHAVITRSGERYIISDQSSTNGTYVNGEKISRRVLEPGDEIMLGNSVFTFKVV